MNMLLDERKQELLALCHRYRVTRLELFGSATGPCFDPAHSDFDFLVEFQSITPEEHADCYFGLLAELQDLFGRGIDLVETKAIANPYFIQAIEPSRALIYAD